MAQSINIAVRCPECNWRVMDKVSPTTGKIEITSQNHSYAVDRESLAGTGLTVTHVNLLDNTVEGVKCRRDRVAAVQYHPESAPGPLDSGYLFDRFLEMMEEGKHA